MTERELLTSAITRWAADARAFVAECLGAKPDRWQDEALRLASSPKTQRLALKACKGPGKTAVLAWIILWFLATRWESKVGATSITESNIDTNLWPELSHWLDRSAFLRAAFVWSKTRVSRRGHEANWFAVKRSWPKTGDNNQQANALAGLHAPHVMFVLDESSGIPQAVMVTAEAVLATEASEAKVIQAGNPTHTTGPLHRACTLDRHLWEVITITGDPDDPQRSPRISMEWAKQQIASYGRDNPWVQVNVLGEFPEASINAILGVEEVERAMRRAPRRESFEWAQKRLGVDVARFGGDRTVVFPRQGQVAFRPRVLRGMRTTDIAAVVAQGFVAWKAELALVDDSGHWGHGVVDNLITAGYPVMPILFGDKALNPRYNSRRTEMWLSMAEWVKAGGALPNLPELVAELTEPTYTFISGKFVLESKDQIKERIQRSPDLADALALTFAIPDMPSDMVARVTGDQVAQIEFDPFRDGLQPEANVADTEFDPFGSR